MAAASRWPSQTAISPSPRHHNTWQFVLVPQAGGSTRLLLRSNMAIEQELPIKLTYFVQFIMERKMLLEIQKRAEQLAEEK